MTAAVLCIGTELTRGELLNGNAQWLGEQLTDLGFSVIEHSVVDDDEARIVAVIERLAASANVVVATGGLGPTTDDVTALACARALGVELVRHDASLEDIKKRFASFGREMSPSNAKQADFPRGADVFPNAVGTAPPFSVKLGQARIFFLPGVPMEMKHLYREHVVPAIAAMADRTSHQIHVRTFGLPESQVGEKLAGLGRSPGVTLAHRAHFPEIEVRSTPAPRPSPRPKRSPEGRRADPPPASATRYGDRDDNYPAYVGRILRDRRLTLAVAESCTGGLLGAMITSVPGSSDYLLLDAVTYSNAAKTALLGVNSDILRAYGAVSEETCAAMAQGALRVSDADLAVAVTGIAGLLAAPSRSPSAPVLPSPEGDERNAGSGVYGDRGDATLADIAPPRGGRCNGSVELVQG
jgi:nicotinamide-nucleotide amidase